MTLKLNEKPIEVWHLDDYIKCPNYAKYNWNRRQIRRAHYLYGPLSNVILSCYRDQANLNKKVLWKTVRNRVHQELAPLLDTKIAIEDYKQVAIDCLVEIRNWYINVFREGPTTCLYNLEIEACVPVTGVTIAGQLDAMLLSPDQNMIVEVTDKFKSNREVLSSLSIRSKIWLLHAKKVKVDKLKVIRIQDKKIKIDTLKIQNYDDFIYKTERTIQWATGSIREKVFHPSITSMCDTCPYKGVCKW